MRTFATRLALIVGCLLLTGICVAAPASADSFDVQADPTTLGEIPPGGGCTTPRVVLFSVSVPPGPITDVGVTFQFSPSHTWAGDLTVDLSGPGGTSGHRIIENSSFMGENSDLTGPYTFSDGAPTSPSFWGAAASVDASTAIPAGSYRAPDSAANAQALITPSFSMSDASGLWSLRFCDAVTADTGTVSAATLHLTTGATAPTTQTDTTTQQTVVDVTAASVEQVLTIEVSQTTVDFGSVEEGESSGPVSVGGITYTNTLNSGNPWDATVAATDLVNGANRIDFENMGFDPGNTITPTGPTPADPPAAFSGGDPSGFSAAKPLANAPASAQGSFNHAGSTASLSVPLGTPAGTDYTGTLQYTITG